VDDHAAGDRAAWADASGLGRAGDFEFADLGARFGEIEAERDGASHRGGFEECAARKLHTDPPCLNLERTILLRFIAVKRSHRPSPRSARIAGRLERVTELAHDESPSIPEKGDDVVADLSGMRVPGQISFGQPH